MYIEDPIIPALGSTPGRQADSGRSRSLLPPPSRGRSLQRSVCPGHHPPGPRHHPAGLDPGGPLGLDHPQPGHRRLASPGADEGAEAPDPDQVVTALPPGPGVRPRAGHVHHAGRIVGSPKGRAPCASLERHRPCPGNPLDRAGHRAGRRRPHRAGHEDTSESTDLPRCRNGHRVESPPGADDGASPEQLGSADHFRELRVQPGCRRLVTLAPRLDHSCLPDDLSAGGGRGRSTP